MQAPDIVRRLLDVEVPNLRTRYAVIALGVLVIGAPLALGGAPDVTVPLFAFVAAVAFVLSGWLPETLRRDSVVVITGVLLAVTAFQLLPLPPGLLRLLDSTSEDASRYALWAFHVDRASEWRPLHHDPGTGLVDLVYLLGLVATFFASMRASQRESSGRLYMVFALAPFVVAGVGLAHLGTGQDMLYAIYRPRGAAPPILSPLLNANHLASLTGAGAVLWLGWAIETERPISRVLRLVGAVLCGAVCALTLSRGGVASAVGSVVIFAALNARTGEGPERRPHARTSLQGLLGYVLGILVLAAGIYLAGTELHQEYQQGDVSKLENIRRAFGLLRGHELFGIGSGAATVAAAASGRLAPDYTFLRVESLPVDLALNVGVIAALVVLIAGARALYMWFPPAYATPSTLAAWAALAGVLAHDLVDFSLYLGGVGYFAAALAGYLAGQRSRRWKRPLPSTVSAVRRGPAFALLFLVVTLGALSWRASLESDRDRLEHILRASPEQYRSDVTRAALKRHPRDAYLQLLAGSYAVTRRDPDAMRFVARAMSLAPSWGQPHLLLARILAARGLRGQCLVEAREVLSRSNLAHPSVARVILQLSPLPDDAELAHLTPRGPEGVNFLNALATQPSITPEFQARVDTLALERDPEARDAITRRARAALERRDLDDAARWCERQMAAHPRDASGYVCASDVSFARRDYAAAQRTLDLAVGRATDRYPVHQARARLASNLRNVAALRRETSLMQESAGSNLERLIYAHALRGELEADQGNDRAAWVAYEMAESLAIPEHPYALPMAEIAHRLGDREGLANACAVLMEHQPPLARAVTLCDPTRGRRAATDAADASVNETPAGDAGMAPPLVMPPGL